MDISKFSNRRAGIIMDERCWKSAVCIPLIETESGYDILFEVRSAKIPDQPGDICLPGGMIEPGETPEIAAVREMCEELFVAPEQIELIGPADILHKTNLIIYPFVTKLRGYDGRFSADECAEVFTVPLEFFLNTEPQAHTVEWRVRESESFPYHLINGGKNYKWREQKQTQLFYLYEDRVIWGITGRIINSFIKTLKENAD